MDAPCEVALQAAQGLAPGIKRIEVEMFYAIVWRLREGRITRLVWFPSHAEGLNAVGLEE